MLVVAVSLVACTTHRGASAPIDPAGALALHLGWWSALANSDEDYLRAHSSPRLVVTLSSGKKHDLDSLVRNSGTAGRQVKIQCADESVQHLGSETALVISECTESSGLYSTAYRFLTFLENSQESWKVAAAQSTWRATFANRISGSPLGDFAGSYRTPRGRSLDVTAGDGFLALREPSGLELRLEPIAPNLFEANYVAPGGWITRYSFDRDPSGRVVSLSVLSPGAVNTFPRL